MNHRFTPTPHPLRMPPSPPARPDHPICELFGLEQSPEAFAIRDFLTRSVVRFEWIEVTSVADARGRGLNITDINQLPVLRLPNRDCLFAPDVHLVAQRLGFITAPRRDEYDLSIFGAGPAGLSAAVYAASEGIKTVLVERSAVGGQAGSSPSIENVIGYPDGVPGALLAERARQQAVKFGVDLLLLREGLHARFFDNRIVADLDDGTRLRAKANLCATGVEYQRLDVPDHDRYLGAGLVYGAGYSEAALAADEPVVVVGGANSAGQSVAFFSARCPLVTMIVRKPELSGSMSAYLEGRLTSCPNVRILTSTEVTALHGDPGLEAITVRNTDTNQASTIPTKRLFVCIGGKPNTDWAADTPIRRDDEGYLITGPDLLDDGALPPDWPLKRQPYYLETSVPGCFAAGDVRHNSVKRFAAALGEGAMCVTFVHRYLRELRERDAR